MIGLGTIINVGAIAVAGVSGAFLGKFLKPKLQDTLIKSIGICVIFIGISGTLEQIFSISNGKIVSNGSLIIVGCFILGTIIGELIDIESRLEKFGTWLKKKTKSDKDEGFVTGFVNASLTVCIGAMAIVGAIQDGMTGDYSLLITKAVLDFIIIFVMASTFGLGCTFSAIPVGILQGLVTILARFLQPIMTDQALSYLSMTGSMLIFCVGVNLISSKKFKVANMLPTVLFAVIWSVISSLIFER